VKKMILALAAVAALVPASSAMAADDLRLEGPSVTLVNALTGGTSGGGPITFAGQQIDGLQSNGAARYRGRDTDGNGSLDDNQLRVSANDVNATPDATVVGILIDTAPGAGVVGADTTQLNGNALQYEVKTQDGDNVPALSNCGSVVLAVPLNPISDIVAASLTLGGDPADLFLNRPAGC